MSGHHIGGSLRRTPAISNLKNIFALDAGASTSILARLRAWKKKVQGPKSTMHAIYQGEDNILDIAARSNSDDSSTSVGDSGSNTDSDLDTTASQVSIREDDHDISAVSKASDTLCQPESITGHVRGGRMCKPLGHAHRRGFADVDALVRTFDDQALADALDELEEDAMVYEEGFDCAFSAIEARAGGDRSESDGDGMDLLHQLHGLPYDLRPTARPRELEKDAVDDDGGDCGVLHPALTLLRSQLHHHHGHHAGGESSFASLETAKFNIDVMKHLRPQAQLEYIFATLPICDAHGNQIRDPGSVGAKESTQEKMARVVRDLRSGVLVIEDGGRV